MFPGHCEFSLILLTMTLTYLQDVKRTLSGENEVPLSPLSLSLCSLQVCISVCCTHDPLLGSQFIRIARGGKKGRTQGHCLL